MSYSEICLMKKDYSGYFLKDIFDSWTIVPNCWNYLFKKYVEDNGPHDTWLNPQKFVDMSNFAISGNDYEDKIVMLFTNLSFFKVSDKKIISDCFMNFFEKKLSSEWDQDAYNKLKKDFVHFTNSILNISNEFEWFGLHCSSVDDCFRSLFLKYDRENDLEIETKMFESENYQYYYFVQFDSENKIDIYKMNSDATLKFEMKI